MVSIRRIFYCTEMVQSNNSEVLNFDLTEKGPNTNGSVMKDGQSVSDVWVSAHTVTGEEQWFNGKTDENGKFSMTLPDGEYQIEGIWIDSESKWYPSVISIYGTGW